MFLKALLQNKPKENITGYTEVIKFIKEMDRNINSSKFDMSPRLRKSVRSMIYTLVPVKEMFLGIIGPIKTKEFVGKKIVEFTRVTNTKVFKYSEDRILLTDTIVPNTIVLKVISVRTDVGVIYDRYNAYVITDLVSIERMKYYEKLVTDLGVLIDLKESKWYLHIKSMINANRELLDNIN